ncbi:MAG: hypothetical protein B7Z30_03865 [Rhizobiales bacterium 12-68-15]|nr:MAG: hypothetical protein B7Z30_03865 [Rhizobiales bacterium 12-68-15]
MADSSANGRIFEISTTGADIVGFDPARDKLDLGDVSVHNCIVVDTPNGVAFMNPWSGEMAVVVGVSLGQLTIDSFVPIQNDHLRQDLSGALAWEQGITPAANTVYARSHEIGQIDRVEFDPATDVVDFRYFGTREQIYMSDSADGVIISNSGTGQALILLGVTKAELTVENFLFHSPQVYEDRVHLQLGFGPVPASQVLPQGVPIAGTNDWPTQAGNGVPPSGDTGVTTVIEWDYGSATAIAFDPAKDKLDFGWFKAPEFSVAEVNGSTVITITGNNQTYTLTGVTLAELELNNIIALDNSARVEWQGLIESAGPVVALPTLSVSDASVAEGASGTSYAVFTVTLSAASASTVTVSYTTLNGTATAGQDYASTVGTLTFAPGETVKTVQVPVSGDTMVELNEAFTLGLSAPVNATIADGTATGTIVNDDMDSAPGTLPAVSIADLSVSEGNGEHMHFMFMVTLDKASTGTVTVNYATAGGTAQAGSDFASTTGTVTFAPGETSKMIHVDILGDTVVEANETFTVSLSGPSGATIADGTATGTILNDDSSAPPVATPAISIGDLTVSEGNGDHVHFMFTVTLDQPSTGTVTVNYATANGTAQAGSDYVAGTGTLTFAPGETSKTIHVDILGDTVAEANETFTVSLSGPSGATIADGTATGTIVNDDAAAPATGGASVDYIVRDNWGSGFVAQMEVEAGTSALNGWVIEFDAGFGAGKDTSFGFQATPGAGGTTATGFTINGVASGGSDPEPVLPALSVGAATITEGDSGTKLLTFTVTLSEAATSAVSVAYATSNGTATAGSDYAATSGTLTFAAGETSKTIQVTVNGDTVVEGNETVNLTLSNASGATIATGSAVGTITNDDVAVVLPTLAVSDATVTEGNSGTKVMSFTVTLSAASSSAVSVAYATSNGTATSGSDYAAATGTLTFAAGETSKTIQVTVNGDTAVEGNETVNLTLSSPSGATIADGAAVGTIANDDTAPATGGAVEYQVASSWNSGFTGSMTVEGGASGLNGWVVEFDAGFTITNIWNAQIVSHVGTHYVIKNMSYNANVGAGKDTSFGFQATPGAGGTVASNFILNGTPVDDAPAPVLPTLAVSDASIVEGNSGTSQLAFTVTLSAAATSAVTVAYATSNGTAQAGADYTALTGTLTFAAGETSKVIYVPVIGDSAVEASETLNLTLSGASGATIADATGVGTITNDDVVLPTLSIADASVAEGDTGTSILTFTVSLSQAATGPVSVQFATGDGTASAGSDYGAASGTLTFAAGETVKTVQVVVNADSTVEASETLTVTLSAPSGATIADGSATGTILNDDLSGNEPVVNVSDTSVTEGDPATGAAAAGWLSTSGNQIIDASGNTVQLAGVNWFGFESSNFAPHGLWTRGYQEMMDQMVDLGFNTIRLPFSSEMLHTTAAPNGIDFSKNPDLQGLSAIEIMDKIVEYAGEIGIRIILDHHRSDAGAGTSDNGLWYNSEYTEAEWIEDWQMLAERYADAPAVIGADLHNEPHNGTWGGGGVNDWAAAAERAGNAIGDVNANWLIFVEGVGSYDGNNYWWGGNLEGVRDRPIDLELDNKLVYSAHDYPNSIYNQPWFQSSDFADQLPAKFDEMWGYIYREGIAPVYIGEFGTRLEDPKDAPWFEAITSYIAGDFDNDGTIDIPEGDQGISWTFWSWNPNSGDTGGILANDWTSVNTNKLAYLEPIMFDFATDVPGGEGSEGGDEVYATFIVSLTEASAEAVTVNYHTMAGSADASDFTPVSGTLTFAPGETSKTIQVAVKSDLLDEADESFSVMLTDASGAVIGIGTATATILDDDTTATTPGTGAGTGSGSGSVEADLEALLAVVDSWNSGFNASVTIHNEGAATSGWQLEIDTPLTITSIWNAEIVSHDAEGYVIRNAAYNAAIGADQSVSFGFTVAGSYDPSQFELHI